MDDIEKIVVVGGGYVGLPMAVRAVRAGFGVCILDRDAGKVESLRNGVSYIGDVSSEELAPLVASGQLQATTLAGEAYAGAFAVLICVPTPLQITRDPDLSYVDAAVEALLPYVEPGMLIALESTVYPGYTREVLGGRLRRRGFEVGKRVFVSFSPERVDPANRTYAVERIPKVVGGCTPACGRVAAAFYRRLIPAGVVVVENADTAEMVKILENTFRAVNIALANEIAVQCDILGIDVLAVIAAAKTKPFGYMPFYPGPGVGGHCIGPDPYYLAWRMKAFRYESQLIATAGRINAAMPGFCVARLEEELRELGVPLLAAQVLVVGVAYKPEVSDTRESPALDVIELLREKGAIVSYVDPFVPDLLGADGKLVATGLDPTSAFTVFAAAIIVTHHAGFDYVRLIRECPLVLDTRGVTRGLRGAERVRDLCDHWKGGGASDANE